MNPYQSPTVESTGRRRSVLPILLWVCAAGVSGIAAGLFVGLITAQQLLSRFLAQGWDPETMAKLASLAGLAAGVVVFAVVLVAGLLRTHDQSRLSN
jgi:hypothetical protein